MNPPLKRWANDSVIARNENPAKVLAGLNIFMFKKDNSSGWQCLLVFALAMLLYFFTLAPDLVWQDQGDYQVQVAELTLRIPGDVVRVHPLYVCTAHFIAKTASLDYAYAANLTSAIFGAITVAGIFAVINLLTKRLWASWLGAVCFGLTHSFWFLSVQAQTYTMANCAMIVGMLCVFKYMQNRKVRYLYLMGLVFGLGVSVHMMSQIAFAVLFVWLCWDTVSKKTRWYHLAGVAISWFVGAALLWYIMAVEYRETGDLYGTILSAIYGRWGNAVFNITKFGLLIKKSVLFLVLNFPTPLFLLAIIGIVQSFRKFNKTKSTILISMTMLYALFAIRYDVPNQNCFFLPMYMLLAIYIGCGFAFMFSEKNKLAIYVSAFLLFVMVATYPTIAWIAKATDFKLGTNRHIPYRKEYSYYIMPWQHGQTGPRKLINETFKVMPAGSVLLCDSTPVSAFEYAMRIEGQRGDVILNPDEIQNSKKVFLISGEIGYRPRWIADDWLKKIELTDEQFIFEVIIPTENQTTSQ